MFRAASAGSIVGRMFNVYWIVGIAHVTFEDQQVALP